MKNRILFPLLMILALSCLCSCSKESASNTENNPGNGNQQTDDPNAPVRTFTVNGVSFNMLRVEGGTFYMGAQFRDQDSPNYDASAYNNESPVHSITLSTYYLAETECTQALWTAVMGWNPSRFQGDERPLETASNQEILQFVEALNEMTGMHFRLPTEAEWEFAARGGNQSEHYLYSGSNDPNLVAWYYGVNPDCETFPVKLLQPNELGLYDMSGNVWELCNDWYGSYSQESQTNPQGPSYGSMRVGRGGGYDLAYYYCRVTTRNALDPNGGGSVGFRLAL